jgi:hypothetical protein
MHRARGAPYASRQHHDFIIWLERFQRFIHDRVRGGDWLASWRGWLTSWRGWLNWRGWLRRHGRRGL